MTNLAAAPGVENPYAMVDYASAAVFELRDGGSGASGYDVRFGFRNGSDASGLAYYPLFGTDSVDMDLSTFVANLEVRTPSLFSPLIQDSLLTLSMRSPKAVRDSQQHGLVRPMRQQRLGRDLLRDLPRPVVRGPLRQVPRYRRRTLYERWLGLHRRVCDDCRGACGARVCVPPSPHPPMRCLQQLTSRDVSSDACARLGALWQEAGEGRGPVPVARRAELQGVGREPDLMLELLRCSRRYFYCV